MAYNPASLRVKENSTGVDVSGVVALVFPNGTVVNLGRGVVSVATSSGGINSRELVSGTQDGVNDTFTIDGTLTWTVVWLLRNGIFVDRTKFSAGGTGNRTLTLTMADLPFDPGSDPELLEVIGTAS